MGCQSEGLCLSPLQFRGSSSWSWFQMCSQGSQDSPGAGLGIFTLAASQGCLYAVRPPAHGAVGKHSDVQPCCLRLGCLWGALLSVSPPLLCLRWPRSTTSPLCGHGKEYAARAEALCRARSPLGLALLLHRRGWGAASRRLSPGRACRSLSCSLTHLGFFESSL